MGTSWNKELINLNYLNSLIEVEGFYNQISHYGRQIPPSGRFN